MKYDIIMKINALPRQWGIERERERDGYTERSIERERERERGRYTERSGI